MSARLVFMGTPRFAVPTLLALHGAGHEILGVVTQPDRRKGRGKKVAFPPVKEAALTLGLSVFQPANVNEEGFAGQLAALSPDVIVTVAFGQILKGHILGLPPRGCLNVHASLLPKYRGAAPIAWAIYNGDSVTGVTIMMMDEGMDTGPILAAREEHIQPDDTTESLGERLADDGARLLVETLEGWLAGKLDPIPQDAERASYAPPLKKSDGKIDWRRPAMEIERQIRSMIPWPGAFTTLDGKTLKIYRAQLAEPVEVMPPGECLVTDDTWRVATGRGALDLKEVQLAGKKRHDIRTFLKGFKPRGRLLFS